MKATAAVSLVLLLAACAGPRPTGDGFDREPPPRAPEQRPEPPPNAPPSHAPTGLIQEKPLAPPSAAAPIAPSGPSGPLTVARVGSYMDALEVDLRRHVHGAGVARQGDGITVTIRNDHVFTADGGIAGDDVLEPLGAVLRGYVHTTIQVNGYTDTTGTPEKNLAVSRKRARQIADALAHEGVASERVASEGFGETHLRVPTGDDKAEARNRRIEIVLKAKAG
jgi:outer membrane protein OmpA-like peptidoglycan-associated protein